VGTTKLQASLDETPYKGIVTRVFSSKFGSVYEVGLVRLSTGEDVVIKIKDNSRAKTNTGAYSREAEYKNLKALEKLGNPLIPEALYYNDGILIMAYMPGEPLRMVEQSSLAPEAFQTIGHTLRDINDFDTSGLDHLIRFDSFGDFLHHEFELFFTERLQLDLLPLSFYEEFKLNMMQSVIDEHPTEIALIAKDAFGGENILVDNGNVSGLIDFEDLMIAPRLLQLRPPIDAEYLPHYIEGYGKEVFDRYYCREHLDILKAISSLRALYLAHEQNAVEWKNDCIKDFNELMSGLNQSFKISI